MREKYILARVLFVVFFLFGGAAWAFPINVRNHNFGVVEEGVLYRSNQPGPKFLERIIRERGIKTIVVFTGSVRDIEREIAGRHSVAVFHLPMTVSSFPSREIVDEFLSIMRNPDNYPVLVHCRAGADRAGLMVAFYRIEIQKQAVCPKVPREMRFYRNLRWLVPMPKLFLKSHYDAPCIKPFKEKTASRFIK